MRHRKLTPAKPTVVIAIAIGVYFMASFCIFLAPKKPAVSDLPPSLKPAEQPQSQQDDPPLVGFALNLHYTDQFYRYLAAVDDIADLGCNSIIIVTPIWQENGQSTEVSLIHEPGRSPGIEQIRQLLEHAENRGLHTTLMPIVLMTNPQGKEWRGRIQPENWHNWWVSYRSAINQFAQLAQQTNVDIFCVGSELLTTEHQADRWRSLITEVRHRYTGRITYSTNWDHYQKTRFWQYVDVIGINGYWDITGGGESASDDEAGLTRNWKTIRSELHEFAKANDQPILLTEIGYPSLSWGLKNPWNYVAEPTELSRPDVQAAGYRAFINAWSPVIEKKLNITLADSEQPPSQEQAPSDDAAEASTGSQANEGKPTAESSVGDGKWFAGVYFYLWDPYHRGELHDTGYGVRGKPAHRLVVQWLAAMHEALREKQEK